MHQDSLSKFHFQHGLDRCKFDHAIFDTTLNQLIVNNKLLTPLYYTHLSLVGQKPSVKKSTKSIANFKLRANMPVGTLTTLHPGSRSFSSYLSHLKFSFLPTLKRQGDNLKVQVGVLGKEGDIKGQLSIGVTDLTYIYAFFLLPSLFYNLTNLGGGEMTLTCSMSGKGRNNYIPVYKFFFSSHSLY
jgi:ribosomal protein L5|tara:strand:+ start:1691 stop:2248 length:558 start_codon:yes stop_codon:yes gene_type:complete